MEVEREKQQPEDASAATVTPQAAQGVLELHLVSVCCSLRERSRPSPRTISCDRDPPRMPKAQGSLTDKKKVSEP